MAGHRSLFKICRLCLLGWLAAALRVGGCWAEQLVQQPAGQSSEVGRRLYIEEIQPVLEQQCLMCHQGESKKGGLDLSSREGLLKGGDSGPALVRGNASASLLYKLVAHQQEPAMPYKMAKLSDQQIARIAEWINAGAPFDLSSAQAPGSGSGSLQPAAQAGSNAGSQLFAQQVRPVLEQQCLVCHGGKFKQVGLSLLTRESLLRGSDNGAVVVPGNASASLLVKKIKHEHQPGMPYQGKKLPDEVIAQVVAWINAGAPYDKPLTLPADQPRISQRPGSEHWAFKLPQRAAVPRVKNQAWVRNPIDAFVAAQQEKRGLKPLPEADKRVLLRRAHLDLIGLPPTVEQLQAFLADRSKNAYEKVVDQLLASPQYGERWGRHWMDVWRYSDWYGGTNEIRNSQQYIWHWRDWIIESLNQDKGYDRMILEMLAGDEIAPTDPNTLRATGYLARNWFRFNRNVWLQDTVEHTAAGFLGITLKCARCHDHKYDPFAQEEYYRFRAFFEPYDVRIDRVPGQPDLRGIRRAQKPTRQPSEAKDGLPRVYDSEPKEAVNEEPFFPAIFGGTYRFVGGDEKNPDKEHPLAAGIPEIFGSDRIKIEPVSLPLEAYYPDSRSSIHQDLIAQSKAEIQKAEATLTKANQALAEARRRVAVRRSGEGVVTQAVISVASSSEIPPEIRPSPGLKATLSQGERENVKREVSFEKEIKPIFENHCFSCHKSTPEKSGLNLETQESILEGGNLNGPAAIAGKSGESPLILYLRGEKKPRMPLGGTPLLQQQIALIGRWIDQLPEDEPEVKLRKAEAAVAFAEKALAVARASLPALEARIAAEKAKYANPPDPQAEVLAQAARKAERQAALLVAEEDLLRAQQKLTEALKAPPPAEEKAEKAREKKIATARKQLKEAEEALGQATETYTPLGKLYPKTSTGRRLALARWIASRDNPLTARVAVNHLWLRHFGKALVPTVVNFGRNGRPPTHPELLDWLASELMEKRWSMKAIHRLMVTSSTYRMQSSSNDLKHPNLSIDPENRYLWRMNPRRMEAEVVRDSILLVAGQLDTTIGGPEIDETLGETSRRRSIYFRQTPNSQMVFLKLFDAANPTDCYERNESIVPQQALAMANSKLSFSQARLLARRLGGQESPTAKFVADTYEAILGRPPSAQERTESEKFLDQQTELFHNPQKLTAFRAGKPNEIAPATDPSLRARESLVHVLLNRNEFVTIR